MMKSVATIDIPQVAVEAYQRQSFGWIPHIFHDYFATHNTYAYLSNCPHPLIEINRGAFSEVNEP